MSHVTTIERNERFDIAVLMQMCKNQAWEWREGQRTYKWFGRYMGDYPLPTGFTKEELGHCSHAIRIPGAQYEIGVIQKNGKWTLLWDFWQGGYGLQEKIGKNGGLLKRSYDMAKAKVAARQHRKRFYERPMQQEGWKKLVVEV